jgi:hypothetical protein
LPTHHNPAHRENNHACQYNTQNATLRANSNRNASDRLTSRVGGEVEIVETTIYLAGGSLPVVGADCRPATILFIKKIITHVNIIHKTQRFGQIKPDRGLRDKERNHKPCTGGAGAHAHRSSCRRMPDRSTLAQVQKRAAGDQRARARRQRHYNIPCRRLASCCGGRLPTHHTPAYQENNHACQYNTQNATLRANQTG